MAKHFLSDRDIEFQRGINRTVRQLQPETVRPNSYHRTETGSAAAAVSYSGYFKITDVSDADGFKVKIADGASDGNSLCMIDDKKFEITQTTFSIESAPATYYIAISYFPAITGNSPTLVRDTLLPSHWIEDRYFLIGRVITSIVNDKMVISSIEQDFIAGMPVIYTKTYAGQFSVVYTDDETISVLDNSAPASDYCGYTDLVGNVPKKTFALENVIGKWIYLVGHSDGSSYSVEIFAEGNESEAIFRTNPIPLARVDSSGRIYQIWTGGNILFSNSYLV